MKKNIFNDDKKESYSDDGLNLNQEFADLITPMFKKYVAMGYKMREISYIMHGAVTDVELEHILEWNISKNSTINT